jgi:hypothetical protein
MGAMGAFLVAAALLVYDFAARIAARGGGGGLGEEGGRAVLAIVSLLAGAGGILGLIGFRGLGKVYGGTNAIGGIFSLILGIGGLLSSVGTLANIRAISEPGMFALIGGLGLTGIFGGLGLMKAPGVGKAGGILLLIAGIVWILFPVLFFVPSLLISLLDRMNILMIVAFLGGAAGFIMAGVAMLGARKGA